MRAHCIMNVPFEGPGYLLSWTEDRGLHLQIWKMYENCTLPQAEEVDLLVVMGGPMNVYQEDSYPFLAGEKQLISSCIRQQRRVLGICLGAQLIADVLGEKIFRNREKEIGWFPLQVRAENRDHYLFSVFPVRFIPFHWHGETFHLPAGTRPLGSTDACLNQGFLYRDHVLALQFHLEITPGISEGLLRHASREMTAGRFVQSANEIRKGLVNGPGNKAILFHLLDRFTEPLLNRRTNR